MALHLEKVVYKLTFLCKCLDSEVYHLRELVPLPPLSPYIHKYKAAKRIYLN